MIASHLSVIIDLSSNILCLNLFFIATAILKSCNFTISFLIWYHGTMCRDFYNGEVTLSTTCIIYVLNGENFSKTFSKKWSLCTRFFIIPCNKNIYVFDQVFLFLWEEIKQGLHNIVKSRERERVFKPVIIPLPLWNTATWAGCYFRINSWERHILISLDSLEHQCHNSCTALCTLHRTLHITWVNVIIKWMAWGNISLFHLIHLNTNVTIPAPHTAPHFAQCTAHCTLHGWIS